MSNNTIRLENETIQALNICKSVVSNSEQTLDLNSVSERAEAVIHDMHKFINYTKKINVNDKFSNRGCG